MKRGTTLLLTGSVVGVVLLAGVWLLAGMRTPQPAPQDGQHPDTEGGSLIVQPDSGLVLDYAAAGDVPDELAGERVVYEAYRFLDPEADCPGGPPCVVDFRQDDVQATVTLPDGETKAVSRKNLYYPVPVYPVSASGTYHFTITEGTGTTFDIDLPVSIANVPDSVTTASQDAGTLFTFDGLEVSQGSLIYYIAPDNHIASLTADADGAVTVAGDLQPGGHVFLTKPDGVWHRATYLVPEAEE